jgi:hypothetical protein
VELMSLINDALKRAKEDLVIPPPSSTLQLKPVDDRVRPAPSRPFWPFVALLVLGLIGLFYAVRQGGSSNPSSHPDFGAVQARVTTPAEIALPTPPPAVETPQATAEELAYFGDDDSLDAFLDEEQPAKPVFKLQAIIYQPKNPLAIINGKSVFRGDRVGNLKVVSISQSTVILAGAGLTNTLSLGQ